MSTFSYSQYQNAVSSAQNRTSSNVRVGWFKLANDGDTAIVRINVSSVEDLKFATIHQLGASTNWMKVSCLNEFGSYSDNCPLCKAAAAGNTSIGKASKRVYIPMLVSYRDPATGTFSTPVPVIWDKPAGFSREIANKLSTYGDLTKVLLKITRNGAKGDMKTTYSIDYAVPTVFKPEMIPEDFSAFNNFKLEKHSFWVKTPAEVEAFLSTGSFPEAETTVAPATAQVTNTPAYTQPVQNSQAVYTTPVQQTPAAQPTQPEQPAQPANKFSGFSF